MFTLEEVDDIHTRLGKATTLHAYLQALQGIGVVRYESYVRDGHSEYFDRDNQKVISSPVHDIFPVSETSNKQSFLRQLKLHSNGKTDYFQMSKGLADSGIEKWVFDTVGMTITYYDLEKHPLYSEEILP